VPLVSQWGFANGMYYAVSDTVDVMPAGLYDVQVTNGTLFFTRAEMGTDKLLRLPGTAGDAVVTEIQQFWERGELYEKFGMTHKRGILLYGPPGSGKTSTLSLVAQDVIAAGGFVITWPGPDLMHIALRQIRAIQPEARVVVLMEDLDAILAGRNENESAVLNLLDGVEKYPKVVFLATTNYIEVLAPRIANRPSRFDKRFKIGHPTAPARGEYLRSLVPEGVRVDVDRMVKDTEGMSLAHLKELLVSTQVIGSDYDETLRLLKAMNAGRASSADDEERPGQYA
jgi:AAA+ superfamily predicted ATPase